MRLVPTPVKLVVLVLAIAVASPFAFADLAPINGGSGAAGDDPPITVGAGWWTTTDTPPAFFWNLGNWNLEGPFTFSWPTSVQLYVTDAFVKGDRFEVYDNDVLIGTTTQVPVAYGDVADPDTAFADPTYSSGVFLLDAGTHAITILNINNVAASGRGYLKVEPLHQAIPEPATLALVGLGVLSLLRRSRKSQRVRR